MKILIKNTPPLTLLTAGIGSRPPNNPDKDNRKRWIDGSKKVRLEYKPEYNLLYLPVPTFNSLYIFTTNFNNYIKAVSLIV